MKTYLNTNTAEALTGRERARPGPPNSAHQQTPKAPSAAQWSISESDDYRNFTCRKQEKKHEGMLTWATQETGANTSTHSNGLHTYGSSNELPTPKQQWIMRTRDEFRLLSEHQPHARIQKKKLDLGV